mmetsp:Transcript_24403/g.76533  ORF Transcript_24403/g.76533 Transcript_24403/m.76533 type:complete len:229 (+) Transcript_24403:359-1045(+)
MATAADTCSGVRQSTLQCTGVDFAYAPPSSSLSSDAFTSCSSSPTWVTWRLERSISAAVRRAAFTSLSGRKSPAPSLPRCRSRASTEPKRSTFPPSCSPTAFVMASSVTAPAPAAGSSAEAVAASAVRPRMSTSLSLSGSPAAPLKVSFTALLGNALAEFFSTTPPPLGLAPALALGLGFASCTSPRIMPGSFLSRSTWRVRHTRPPTRSSLGSTLPARNTSVAFVFP